MSTETQTNEIKPKEIYEKMIAQNLNYVEMAEKIQYTDKKTGLLKNITAPGLFYHIKNYCEANNLPKPIQKRGRRKEQKIFTIKD